MKPFPSSQPSPMSGVKVPAGRSRGRPVGLQARCFISFLGYSLPVHRAVALMLVVSGVGLILLAGCAGYQLGPTNGLTAGSRSIQVNPFVNQTPEPRLIGRASCRERVSKQV